MPFRRLVALVCIVAFGLNASVCARGLVYCQNADGTTRLEWGCDRDVAGHCEQVCGSGAETAEPDHDESDVQPCDDDPVSWQAFAMRHGWASTPVALLAPLPVQVTVMISAPAPLAVSAIRDRTELPPFLQPPSVQVVRAVKLLV